MYDNENVVKVIISSLRITVPGWDKEQLSCLTRMDEMMK